MSKHDNPSGDGAQRLRGYLDEVHRRNEQSREQRERLAGTPEVGIFWVANGKLIIAGAWIRIDNDGTLCTLSDDSREGMESLPARRRCSARHAV